MVHVRWCNGPSLPSGRFAPFGTPSGMTGVGATVASRHQQLPQSKREEDGFPPKTEDAEGYYFCESAGEHIVCAARIIVGPRIFLTSAASLPTLSPGPAGSNGALGPRNQGDHWRVAVAFETRAAAIARGTLASTRRARSSTYPVGPFRSATGKCDDCAAMGPDP